VEKVKKMSSTLARREFVQSAVEMAECKTLEIGALNIPTFDNKKTNIMFADYCDSEMLKEKYPHKADKIIDVDYVLSGSGNPFAEIDEKFDLVVANHVFEHVPDPITWLGNLADILTSKGRIFLSLPDKRYTFDRDRNVSSFEELVECHHLQLTEPSFVQLFRHYFYYQKIKAADVWEAPTNNISTPYRCSMKDAYARALDVSKKGVFTSIHCHVYTDKSFYYLINSLSDMKLIPFDLEAMSGVSPLSNEFYAILGLRKLEKDIL
jgi:SAM-dependent methyltransferase